MKTKTNNEMNRNTAEREKKKCGRNPKKTKFD